MAFIGRPLFANRGDVELMEAAVERKVILSLPCGSEFRRWLNRLAQHCRTSCSSVMDLALVDFAKETGFAESAPRRNVGRA
jgi:hypothetical protein